MRDCGTRGIRAARPRERLRRQALGNDGGSIGGATPQPTADRGGEAGCGEKQKMSVSERHYVRLS